MASSGAGIFIKKERNNDIKISLDIENNSFSYNIADIGPVLRSLNVISE